MNPNIETARENAHEPHGVPYDKRAGLAAWDGAASPSSLIAGALAHLARHMETGCPRASSLAILLLEKVASDAKADAHLRRHARELVNVLERDESEIH